MIVFENGSIVGTIGGGALEKKVIEQALHVLKSKEAGIFTHNLVSELAMCCGGSVDLFIEPIMNKKKLYIFGAGHTGKALAKFATDLNFSVSLIDERSDAFDGLHIDDAVFIQEQHATAIDSLPFDEHTFVVILTHDHVYDREILALCSARKHAYIGMIGSERKVEMAKKMLVSAELISQKQAEEVNMPIGIDIHAITPEEIAISILAKLIEVRNRS